MPANKVIQLLPPVARTATVATDDQRNAGYSGVKIHIDVTAVTSTPAVTFTVQGKDSQTDDYYTLLASTAIATTGDTFLLIYPGATAAANAAVNMPLPPHWRVNCVHGNANSITYELTAELYDE